MNSIVEFNHYVNSPVANYQGKLYNLPFNMNTFYQMWGVTTPIEAIAKIEEQKMEAMAKMKADGVFEPRNLEEQAQILIGKDIYEKLIKGYTEKQWGRKCIELPAFIIKRLPVRFCYEKYEPHIYAHLSPQHFHNKDFLPNEDVYLLLNTSFLVYAQGEQKWHRKVQHQQ